VRCGCKEGFNIKREIASLQDASQSVVALARHSRNDILIVPKFLIQKD
jgi:hypothetical protein